MNEAERNQIKWALLKCAEENENRPTLTGYVVVSSVCRSAVERINELEALIKSEHEIEARKNNNLVSQVTKAKELIKELLKALDGRSGFNEDVFKQAEQFLEEKRV